MILQLSFLLDTSFNKYITFEIIVLVKKKSFKPNKKLKKKPYIFQLMKNLLNLIKKQERKLTKLIDYKISKTR